MGTPYQSNYQRYQGRFWPGMQTRPGEPWVVDAAPCHVPNGGTLIEPGMGVCYDQSLNAWKLPTSDVEERQVIGVVVSPRSIVPTSGIAVGDSGNSDVAVRYADESIVTVCRLGTVAVIAGGAAEYGSLMRFQRDDRKWDAYTIAGNPSGYQQTHLFIGTVQPFECADFDAVADGDIMELRIGFGRLI